MADFEHAYQGGTAPSFAAMEPLDFSHYYSRTTVARQASSMKDFYKYFMIPGIGNLAGGLPNRKYFPYDTLEAQVAQPSRWVATPNDPNALAEKLAAASSVKKKKSDTSAPIHMTVPHGAKSSNPLTKIDLDTALQYGTAQGYPPLYSFLRQFTRDHLQPNIPYKGGAEIILTVGNTDGFSKTLECLSNPWNPDHDWIGEREGILVEAFSYPNALGAVRPRGLTVTPVAIDGEGLVADGPGGMEDVLANWDTSLGKRPHLLYTVTIGQNPTSGVLSLQRRKELYAVCSKYNVIIIEDEPYWYLQFPSAATLEAMARGTTPPTPVAHTLGKSSGYPYLDSLVPSFLNVDTDGRVVRLDTFSKTVAPGCRVGWITAQPNIIERLLRITETSTQQPSGFVQSMLAELVMGPQVSLEEFKKKSRDDQASFSGWKMDGWVRWIEGLRGSYERRMQRMSTILDDGQFYVKQGTPNKAADSEWAVISKTQMYSFDWPRGGMFIWVKLHFETHPLFSAVPAQRLAHALWIFFTLKPYLVLVSPGAMFSPTDEIREAEGYKYFRLCFAAVEEPEIERCSNSFANAVQKFWTIKSVEDLDRIDGDADSYEAQPELMDLSSIMGC
ncbi:pyridoxal phosphate-dependent transferase [Calycina marina]|uniref:Pyridoxal phosphate-dependent transferase n=1 Tax=Calycina marina TaxID=1763456 RepID=A0A9P7Z613_9HELO|nr:pyridoxal phosphate-dependent transferase [Calycina marina]